MARLFMTVTDRRPRLPSEPLLRLSGSFGGRHPRMFKPESWEHPRMFKPESWVTSSVFWNTNLTGHIIADAVLPAGLFRSPGPSPPSLSRPGALRVPNLQTGVLLAFADKERETRLRLGIRLPPGHVFCLPVEVPAVGTPPECRFHGGTARLPRHRLTC